MSDTATRERLARLEAAVARSLELLQAGLADDAQRELARVGAVPASVFPGPGAISELELEEAFEAAEPETSRMRHADDVAREALREAGAEHAEIERALDVPVGDGENAGLPPSFATATMAELLEKQGDAASASAIRANLGGDPIAASRPGHDEVVQTLERWLDNLRRPRA